MTREDILLIVISEVLLYVFASLVGWKAGREYERNLINKESYEEYEQ